MAKSRMSEKQNINTTNQNGGLNRVDIESFFNSLQAGWIGRIVNSNQNWAYIGNKLLYMNHINYC